MKVFKDEVIGDVRTVELGYSPMGHPFMTTRIYQVDHILFDTGLSHLKKVVLGYLTENPVSAVYLTHYHEDHSGNAASIKEHFKVPVFGHPVTVEKLKKPLPIFPYQRFIWGAARPVALQDLPEKIETENYCFFPIHTPGHSRDHTLYYEPGQGWLFSGDLYLGDRVKFFRADEDLLAQVNSLKQVLKLDFDRLFCAHNPRLSHGKDHLRQKHDFLENLYEEVNFLWGKGMEEKRIMEQLGIKEEKMTKLICSGNISAQHMIRSAIRSVSSLGDGTPP